ncbi:MAG: AsmA family protein, partial [bacterium]|nr:AsmA family protein [bacterium]
MSRLYVIIGGLVVIVLFTALIAPWFINWDDYKATFEAEAEKILGQPVRVHGSADASILPSPSLTFTDVKVGDTEGRPMMTVDRFAVTIELLPLIQGEIRVVSMTLEKPVVRVSVDDTGQVDWLLRSDASR